MSFFPSTVEPPPSSPAQKEWPPRRARRCPRPFRAHKALSGHLLERPRFPAFGRAACRGAPPRRDGVAVSAPSGRARWRRAFDPDRGSNTRRHRAQPEDDGARLTPIACARCRSRAAWARGVAWPPPPRQQSGTGAACRRTPQRSPVAAPLCVGPGLTTGGSPPPSPGPARPPTGAHLDARPDLARSGLSASCSPVSPKYWAIGGVLPPIPQAHTWTQGPILLAAVYLHTHQLC